MILRLLVVLLTFLSEYGPVPPVHCEEGDRDGGATCALYEDFKQMECLTADSISLALTDSETWWIVEFYSSWCGHCQHFAPTWKEFAVEVEGWSSLFRVGAIDCAEKENRQKCSEFRIHAFPSIHFYNPRDPTPSEHGKNFKGGRSTGDLKNFVIAQLEGDKKIQRAMEPLVGGIEKQGDWTPLILIFEREDSFLGREIVLDLWEKKDEVRVFRVLETNTELVQHYSVLGLPSVVIEVDKDQYELFSGDNLPVPDPRKFFLRRIQDRLHWSVTGAATTAAAAGGGVLPQALLETREEGEDGGVGKPEKSLSAGLKRDGKSYRISRITLYDVFGAVSYGLREEVSIHTIISGSAFTALLKFVHLLETVFKCIHKDASASLSSVRYRLESKASSGFILNRDWKWILENKLDPEVFPLNPKWKGCAGSKPHYRGYPCALWALMHTVTILTLPLPPSSSSSSDNIHTSTLHKSESKTVGLNKELAPPPRPKLGGRGGMGGGGEEGGEILVGLSSRDALTTLTEFVVNFFSCEECRNHFKGMAEGVGSKVNRPGEAALWLWEAHNAVNRRLSGTGTSSDPLHPKSPFPPWQMCPYCYVRAPAIEKSQQQTDSKEPYYHSEPSWDNLGLPLGETLLLRPNSTSLERESESARQWKWNQTAVMLFLWNFYSFNRSSTGVPVDAILRMALPVSKDFDTFHKKYAASSSLGVDMAGHSTGLGFNTFDVFLCFLCYGTCGCLVLCAVRWVARRGKRRLRYLLPR